MTKKEKRAFMRELTRNILRDALAKVPNMPEEWDGHELRRYLADKFLASADMTQVAPSPRWRKAAWGTDRKRTAAYRNTIATTNL